MDNGVNVSQDVISNDYVWKFPIFLCLYFVTRCTNSNITIPKYVIVRMFDCLVTLYFKIFSQIVYS